MRARSLVVGCALSIMLLGACTGDTAPSTTTSTEPVVITTTSPPTTVPPATTTTELTTSTTQPRTDNERCLSRAEFGDPAESPYALPYPSGEGYTVIQSYCHREGSHDGQLAYDFAMPLGSTVVAARGGVVVEVKEDVEDDANTRFLNYVLVRHDDATVAFYAHLQHNGSLVEVGDEVAVGEPIALSGDTGRTGPGVLHFGVYFSYPPIEGRDEPIVFNNAEGALDSSGGLREGTFYRALD